MSDQEVRGSNPGVGTFRGLDCWPDDHMLTTAWCIAQPQNVVPGRTEMAIVRMPKCCAFIIMAAPLVMRFFLTLDLTLFIIIIFCFCFYCTHSSLYSML